MKIHDDAFLYKTILAVFLLLGTFILIVAAIAGGLKMLLFAGWCLIIAALFFVIVGVSLYQKTTAPLPKSITGGLFESLIEFPFFRGTILLFMFLLLALTSNVWKYLDQQFPYNSEQISSVSNISSAMDLK